MAQLGWYLKRLRVMSGPELLHRARQAGTVLVMSAQHRLGVGIARPVAEPARFAFCSGLQPRLPPLPLDLAALQAAAGELLEGKLPVAGREWQWDASPDRWYRAPDTGRIWPRGFFGSIPYLHGNPCGEVRQLWEPARLQQLVDLAALAQAGDAEQRTRAVRLVEAQLESWVASNPPLSGPHYISAIECGLRLMAACHALDLLRSDLAGPASWHALVQIVGSHAPLIERRLSLHSSTGNHTVAEAGGLVYAGLLFPELPGSARWVSKGVSLLARLAQTQVLPDGGGAEQAPVYHLYNLHFLALVDALLRKHGRPAPAGIAAAVARGTRFIRAMDTGDGSLPSIGDDDGGHALSRFLRLPCEDTAAAGHPTHFPQSGYTVVQVATTPDARMILDHGPLGMPPSFGHGHADALSLQIYAAGLPVLVDPGTYTYTGDQDWRRYFRGTRAHNTVTVDGRDQARQEGSFLWSRPFQSRVIAAELEGESSGRMLAEHDGYRDLGIRHVRGIAWQRDAWLLVWDALLGPGEHLYELHWHLGSQPTRLDGETCSVGVPGGTWSLSCSGGQISVHTAERAPIRGWRSPTFGVIEPCPTLRVSFRGQTPHTFETLIRLGGDDPPAELIASSKKWMHDLSR